MHLQEKKITLLNKFIIYSIQSKESLVFGNKNMERGERRINIF